MPDGRDAPLRILVAHNRYLHRGGEDSVVDAEIALLRARGHEVATYFRHNDDIEHISSVAVARQALWSSATISDISEFVRDFKPDVIHAHNTFPLISPSLYWVAARADVPVVQTLHNFRLLCLNGLFLRNGQVCQDCLGRSPWRGIAHKCYRDSRSASLAPAAMLTLHRGIGTYREKVARYIALNEFCRRKFVEGGVPAERIAVKPHFVDSFPSIKTPRKDLLFVGRLSAEKGIATLIRAAAILPHARLRVAGVGPEATLLHQAEGVTPLGRLSRENVRQEMNRAVALVVPSVCYETFGLAVIEAFAMGTPVIASRIGALAELVRDGVTGLLFEPGNPRDLADKMAWAIAHPEHMADMGRVARAQYETDFSADENYRQLIGIYNGVIAAAKVGDDP